MHGEIFQSVKGVNCDLHDQVCGEVLQGKIEVNYRTYFTRCAGEILQIVTGVHGDIHFS